MRLFWAILLLFGLAAPAHAQWYEAQSDNFVIYARDKAQDVQRFGEMLERYHAAMKLLTGRDVPKPSPSNRVTIYVVGNERAFSKLDLGNNVAGFYMPRASGSSAFVPEITLRGREPDFSVIVLMHEYAHHFLMSGSRHAMPRWLSEGAAEFFASTKFPDDGSVQIGRPAYHRGAELAYGNDVTVEELLDHKAYARKRSAGNDSFYGRAWALYHYLNFSETRQGQLTTYWKVVAGGTPARKAAEQVFGDFGQLEKELNSYLKKPKIMTYNIRPSFIKIGEVSVRPLSAGLSEAMPLIIRSRRGVDEEGAAKLLPEIQEVAAKYPQDAGVLAELAEAEFDAGNNDAAIAAADRAITIDPSVKNAYVQKGYALFRLAREADNSAKVAAYRTAMAPFTQLNALENDHALPLMYYYLSFVERGVEPPEDARHALERALEVAPFDQSLAMQVAIMQMQEGRIEWARGTLEPLAADPHGESLATQASNLIAALKDQPEGTAFDPIPTLTIADALPDIDIGGEP